MLYSIYHQISIIFDLNVVCDFCHDVCRLDTFASASKFVRRTRSYHQAHIKTQSVEKYFNMFQNSDEYENMRTTKSTDYPDGDRKPTIEIRPFSNAFCPCCLHQKQRDCANHEIV